MSVEIIIKVLLFQNFPANIILVLLSLIAIFMIILFYGLESNVNLSPIKYFKWGITTQIIRTLMWIIVSLLFYLFGLVFLKIL